MKSPIILLLLCLFVGRSAEAQIKLATTTIDTATVAKNLFIPWEVTWGPDNHIWFTQIKGKVGRLNPETQEISYILESIPDLWFDDPKPVENMTCGLFSMVLHPNFEANPYVYLYYTFYESAPGGVKIVRYTYDVAADQLTNPLVLLDDIPATSVFHNSGRMVITPNQKLLLSTGDRSELSTPQDKNSLNGKLLRMNLDGSIPTDNPDPSSYVYSIGHRHAQGLVYSPDKTILYSSEHGPNTDDELNIIEADKNYGWPNVKGFCNTNEEQAFCATTQVTEPIKNWFNIIAPCGLDYYNSDAIPEWKRSLLLMTLKERDMRVLKLSADGRSVTDEQVFFNDGQGFGRLRDLCVSPDGDVYVATTNQDDNGKKFNVAATYGFPDYDRIVRISSIVPQGLQASVNGETVQLAWKDRWNKEQGFQVYRAQGSPANFQLVATLDANQTTYQDNPPASGTYYYRVRAFNGSTTSDYSNVTSAEIQVTPPSAGTGLSYTLYGNITLSGSPLRSGVDATVNFDWKSAGKAADLPANNFSVHWTGQVEAQYGEEYTFYTRSDDGVRLWVNGQQIINNWTDHAAVEDQGKITLQAGQKYDICLEYYEQGGQAVCELRWSSASQSKEVIPQVRLYPEGNATTTEATYTVRARGLQGTERMALQIGGTTVQSWTVSAAMKNYNYTGSETGSVRVAITNDQGKGHDLIVDKLTVDGTVYQAEAQAVNTGVWQNGSCGGSNSQWLHCSGYIEFDLGSANARQADQLSKQSALEQPASPVVVFPNPSQDGSFTVQGVARDSQVKMYDLQGKSIAITTQAVAPQRLQVQPRPNLPKGLYLLQVQQLNGQWWQGKIAVE